MRRRAFAAFALLLLLGACTEAPMSRDEGQDFAERALRASEVEIEGDTKTESKDCGRSGLPGWSTTFAGDDGSSIEVCVYRRGDRAAFVRDVGPAGVGPLLTDDQFRRLEAFRYDPVGERRNRVHNRLSIVATVLLAAVVATLVVSRLRRRPSDRSS